MAVASGSPSDDVYLVPDETGVPLHFNSEGVTPQLSLAIIAQNEPAVAALLEQMLSETGRSINDVDFEGFSPLQMACAVGNLDVGCLSSD